MCVLIVFGYPAILSILIYSKKLINFLFWQIFITGKKRRAATFNKFFASTVGQILNEKNVKTSLHLNIKMQQKHITVEKSEQRNSNSPPLDTHTQLRIAKEWRIG